MYHAGRARFLPAIAPADLARALTLGEIGAAYQPKVLLETGDLVGVEALARWHSPLFGSVAPEVFIPIAERHALIGQLSDRILHDALATCARLRRRHPTITMAVNISPVLLDDASLPERIDAALACAGVPATALVAEITESLAITDTARASATLGALRARGIGCAIDDFGTGHASLLSLLRLPFSELKIDRAFVTACASDRDAEQIVRATIGLAREMRLSVVAEGIETEPAERLLRSLGCSVGQGYRYGRPVTEAAIAGRTRSCPPALVTA
jgi:EAL domain-containing protein (putative c-di-GMP-specific phosphodiesterase class I)